MLKNILNLNEIINWKNDNKNKKNKKIFVSNLKVVMKLFNLKND
jgi:hypothetical protein